MEQIDNKPCLIETGQGFCVKYKDRLLYSKYNPQKNILNVIQNLEILPGTLILACSPVLGYGLQELCKKIPSGCLIALCEFEDALKNFSKPYLSEIISENQGKIVFLSKNDIYSLNEILLKKHPVLESGEIFPQKGTFRRAVKIDFSAATQFHAELYSSLQQVCQNAIGQVFKNQVTLSRFGRRYSHNLFRNLTNLPDSVDLSLLAGKIEKPLFVLGTGNSVTETICKIRKHWNRFFTVSLDATIPVLSCYGLKPDIVVSEEAQSIISGMFTGNKNVSRLSVSGLTGCPNTVTFSAESNSFFLPAYTDADFITKLSSIAGFPPLIKPLGSVGNTAVYISLYLRKNSSVPVFFSGLDFSYEPGLTHAKGSLAMKRLLIQNTKIRSLWNFASSFSETTFKVPSTSGRELISTKALKGYADLFSLFRQNENIWDLRNDGINLNIPDGRILIENILKESNDSKSSAFNLIERTPEEKNHIREGIKAYFVEELKNLKEAKDILTGKTKNSNEESESRLTQLLESREYLFLHFPDGIKFSLELSFLKRIRTEIDFFIKEFNTDLSLLKSEND